MFRWDPEAGQLFIRELWNDEGLIESHLGCIVRPRNHAQAGLTYIVLLESTGGITSVKCMGASHIDYVYGKEEILSETRKVCRRLASNQDLHGLLKKWDNKERLQPDDWIEQIYLKFLGEKKLLSLTEFERLKGIATQYVCGHPLNKRSS